MTQNIKEFTGYGSLLCQYEVFLKESPLTTFPHFMDIAGNLLNRLEGYHDRDLLNKGEFSLGTIRRYKFILETYFYLIENHSGYRHKEMMTEEGFFKEFEKDNNFEDYQVAYVEYSYLELHKVKADSVHFLIYHLKP